MNNLKKSRRLRYAEEISYSYFLSPQENFLIGKGINPIYDDRWYTPLAIQDNWKPGIVAYIRDKLDKFKIPASKV